ncbi:MAG: phosphoglycerate kinase [Candidatus Woesearchaeota archaeon]
MYFKLKDFNFKNKKVLLRVDFNVPIKNNVITDDSRIKKALPTITYILKQNPKQLIIISHLGRPNSYSNEFSLKPVCQRLNQLLEKEFILYQDYNFRNIKELPDLQRIMLENIRFDKGEEKNDLELAKKLASFADLFVFDAFGVCHREQASVSGIPKFLPSSAGFLMEKEVTFLKEKMENPEKPFVAIIGGAKEDKIEVIDKLIEKVDTLIIGGILANTFLKAKGHNIGNSKYSQEYLEYAKKMLEKYPNKIALPVDFICADSFSENAKTRCAGLVDDITGWIIMDIGPYTITGYKEILSKAKTVVWAGPIGVFEWEAFKRGTWDIARHLAELNITKIIGGGDSGDAIVRFGLEEKMTLVSTGGGASLELLSGKEMPGIKALEENYETFKNKKNKK